MYHLFGSEELSLFAPAVVERAPRLYLVLNQEDARDLQVGPETELYFALVPYYPDDQPEGTTAAQIEHIDTALSESAAGRREWGICTECGMGRVEAGDVPRLLDLHREILAA